MSWLVDVKAEILPPTHAEQVYLSEDRSWWKSHVHRNRIHHLSLTQLALQMGIVKKTRKHGSLLVGNDKGEFYSLMPFGAAAQTHSFQALHAMGLRLNMLPLTRTNAEWAQAQRQASAATDTLNLKRSQYH